LTFVKPVEPVGCMVDLSIPGVRAWAIASGLVWSGPQSIGAMLAIALA
jgi:hypothetical protein